MSVILATLFNLFLSAYTAMSVPTASPNMTKQPLGDTSRRESAALSKPTKGGFRFQVEIAPWRRILMTSVCMVGFLLLDEFASAWVAGQSSMFDVLVAAALTALLVVGTVWQRHARPRAGRSATTANESASRGREPKLSLWRGAAVSVSASAGSSGSRGSSTSACCGQSWRSTSSGSSGASVIRKRSSEGSTEEGGDTLSDDATTDSLSSGASEGHSQNRSRPSTSDDAGMTSRWRWRLNQALTAAIKSGGMDKAEQILMTARQRGFASPDSFAYNTVISAYARSGNLPRAEFWLAKMKAAGVIPTAVSFNILADACAKSDDPISAEAWMTRMIKEGVEPNSITYSTIIHASAKQGDVARAEDWLHKMLASGVEPSIVCYNSLISACGRSADVASAERWMREAQQRGLEPRVTTYTALIDVCAKAGLALRAEEWLMKMEASGLEPNIITYGAILDACAKSGDASRAKHWIQTMADRGVEPNSHTLSAAIAACGRGGDVDGACQLLAKMADAGIGIDVVTFSSALDACASAGETERALKVFRSMEEHGIDGNIVSYSVLARAFSQKGCWEDIERLELELRSKGLRPNEYFLYALLVAYATAKPRESSRAEAAFRKACEEGVEVNRHIQLALGRAVGRSRSVQLVEACCGDKMDGDTGAATIASGVRQPRRARRSTGSNPVIP